MEPLTNENDILYGVYDSKDQEIKYPIHQSLEDAKKALELTIIRNFNYEIKHIDDKMMNIQRQIDRLDKEERSKLQKAKPIAAKKPVVVKKPVVAKKAFNGRKKQQESESSEAESAESDSESESGSETESNYFDSDDECGRMNKVELEAEYKKYTEKYENKYDILVEVKNSLKIVKFTVL